MGMDTLIEPYNAQALTYHPGQQLLGVKQVIDTGCSITVLPLSLGFSMGMDSLIKPYNAEDMTYHPRQQLLGV